MSVMTRCSVDFAGTVHGKVMPTQKSWIWNDLREKNMNNAILTSRSAPSTTEENVQKSPRIWITWHHSSYSECSSTSFPQTLRKNKFHYTCKCTTTQQRNTIESSSQKQIKMESWERNQLHVVFSSDNLRLKQKGAFLTPMHPKGECSQEEREITIQERKQLFSPQSSTTPGSRNKTYLHRKLVSSQAPGQLTTEPACTSNHPKRFGLTLQTNHLLSIKKHNFSSQENDWLAKNYLVRS
jgi:hypothetical protein